MVIKSSFLNAFFGNAATKKAPSKQHFEGVVMSKYDIILNALRTNDNGISSVKLAKIAKYKEMLEKQNKPPEQVEVLPKAEEQKIVEEKLPEEQTIVEKVEEQKSSILKKKKVVNEPV